MSGATRPPSLACDQPIPPAGGHRDADQLQGWPGTTPASRGRQGRRGRRDGARPGQRQAGSTPACAGRTGSTRPTGQLGGAPPRGGEDEPHQPNVLPSLGAPPRARRRQRARPPDQPESGSTPGCAGRTSRSATPSCEAGSTPAYAGKAPTRCSRWSTPWEHPRVRGGLMGPLRGEPGNGAPPHARGGHAGAHVLPDNRRSIPACAGEDIAWDMRSHTFAGASPRARGRRRGVRGAVEGRGSTPAYAGKTVSWGEASWCQREHPRVRGEDKCAISSGRANGGAPPRTRGGHVHR